MDLSKFPMDEQTCTLAYESFSYNNKEVMMRWKSDGDGPILMLKNFTLPDFELVDVVPTIKVTVRTKKRYTLNQV